MAKRCVRFKKVWSPYTGDLVKRCAQWSGGGSSLGGIFGGLGQTETLRETMASVKDVVIDGGLAAGGAVLTDKLFSYVADKLNLEGYPKHLAEAAVGIALGIGVGKVLKKPRMGAIIGVGPVVLAALRIIGEAMQTGPFAGAYLGSTTVRRPLGSMITVDPYKELQGLGSMVQVGPGQPSWMMEPNAPAMAGAADEYIAAY